MYSACRWILDARRPVRQLDHRRLGQRRQRPIDGRQRRRFAHPQRRAIQVGDREHEENRKRGVHRPPAHQDDQRRRREHDQAQRDDDAAREGARRNENTGTV